MNLLERASWPELLDRLAADLRRKERSPEVAARDEPAWSELRRRLASLAAPYRAVAEIGPRDIEDVIQEMLISLGSLDRLDLVRNAVEPDAYLRGWIHNATLSPVRKRLRETRLAEQVAQEYQGSSAAIEAETDEALIGALQRLLPTLSREDRRLIEMRYFQRLSLKRIAEELGLNYTTLHARYVRLLKQLRDRLSA